MQIFEDLIGNEEIKNTLGNAILNSTFSHAYIIEGNEGTGKRTLARMAAAAIICKSKTSRPCGTCESCRKILAGKSVDVISQEITKVEQVRELKATINNSPSEYDYKIYIIENAQKMTIKAQNALLISLEEPPSDVIFFLLVNDAGSLLETIRSRAITVHMSMLSRDILFDQLKNVYKVQHTDEEINEIVMASNGSLGQALNLANIQDTDSLKNRRELSLKLAVSLLKNDSESIKFLYTLSSTTREELKDILNDAANATIDLMTLKKDKNADVYFFSSKEDAIKLSSQFSPQKILSVYNSINEAYDDLLSNSNVMSTLFYASVKSKKGL